MVSGRPLGAPGRIFLAETLGRRTGCRSRGRGTGQKRKVFIATIDVAAIFFATTFVATTPFATIRGEKLAAAIMAGVVAGRIAVRKIFAMNASARKILAGEISAGLAGIRRSGVRLDLIVAHGGQIVGYGFFFVKPDLAGVGAYKPFIEDAAGKLVKVLVFEGAEHAGADFGGIGDGIELDAPQLALLTKFFPERTQGQLRRTGLNFRPHRDGNNHRRRRGRTPEGVA